MHPYFKKAVIPAPVGRAAIGRSVIRHCERPKGAKQSPLQDCFVAKNAPRNDRLLYEVVGTRSRKAQSVFLFLLLCILISCFLTAGCATLFGWDIHAPGVLSSDFAQAVQPLPQRVALYLDPQFVDTISTDRGSRWSDPQTYHVGEAFHPMLIEAFQESFEEFVLLEVEPTTQLLHYYGIPYLVVVNLTGFDNAKGEPLGRQVLTVTTTTQLFDAQLQQLAQFTSHGASDARGVFKKRGGPEVNLNAAIERNLLAIIQFLQDGMREREWHG